MRANVTESMENKGTMKELLTNVRYRKAVYVIAGKNRDSMLSNLQKLVKYKCNYLLFPGLKVLQYMTGSVAIQSYLEMIFRQSSAVSGPRASIVYGFVQLGAGKRNKQTTWRWTNKTPDFILKKVQTLLQYTLLRMISSEWAEAIKTFWLHFFVQCHLSITIGTIF